jgi:hypothetical protein
VQTIAERIGRSVERQGLIARDIENSHLAFDPREEAPINTLLGHSIHLQVAPDVVNTPNRGLRRGTS